MKLRAALLACASLFLIAPAFAQDTSSPPNVTDPSLLADAKAFGSREAVSNPSLSPDGTGVLYTTPGPGSKTFAVISNLVTGKTSILSSTEGADSLRWCDYAAPERIVCKVTGAVVDSSGDILGFSRLVAMNADGSDQKLLGQPESSYDAYARQYDGSILDWKKRADGNVLIERQYVPEAGKMGSNIVRNKEGLGVDLIDTRTLASRQVEIPNGSATDFMSDGRGNVRIMRVDEAKNDGTLTGRVKYFYRAQGSRDWKTIADYADSEQQVRPLAVDADIDSLYALKKNGGRYALYAIKLNGSGAETLIAANPEVDIDNVVRVGTGMKVIGYTYSDESRHAIYFDPEFKGLAASLGKALPKLPLIDFVDSSADGRKLLIFASSDTDPGRYYLFDRDTKTLNEAMLDRPSLEGRTLAEVKPVTVTGSDGAQIPAYLTLPPGKAAKGLPAVILPHGGPAARDEWGFDWLPQFLAARGYAVLQPEYRGSAGYGDTWLNVNGFRNWRTSMSDIAASTRWLAAQGIADPKRVAIVGWSYGGYAALMEAETDPSLYKAVVAVAPVTDLQSLKQDSAHFTDARVVEDFVGSGPHILEGSPLRHTAQIQVPVLLAHGDLDQNVRFSESQKMASALKGDGKQVEFVEYKGLDHQLNDSLARTDLLTRVGGLLDRTIGH
ncbi:MAG TPA: S9 family peptidase [Sphingomicrobium sp.]|nr:S9 family peptidase [Sphingomicrobium sp.]